MIRTSLELFTTPVGNKLQEAINYCLKFPNGDGKSQNISESRDYMKFGLKRCKVQMRERERQENSFGTRYSY